ncbi:MAG: hypothetical protein IPK19_18975 [Chloroflexi bacterium]|nr:hypothetical protein [Chloroflexota bacterium]
MRERAITTAIIWIAAAFGIDRLIASTRFSEWIRNPDFVFDATEPFINQVQGWYQTVSASGEWQFAVVALVALLLLCVAGATIAMWATAPDAQRRSARESEEAAARIKAKRRDPEREKRLRRLLDSLDDDDLEALEQFEMGDDGERVSVDELLRRR